MIRLPLLGAALALFLLTACTGTPTMQDKQSGEFPGLNKVSSTGFSEVWSRPDAKLKDYASIDINALATDQAVIKQPSGSGYPRKDWELTEQRQQALSQAWDESMRTAADQYGLRVGAEGDKVLRIQAAITEIAPTANLALEQQQPGRSTVYTENSGKAAIEIKIFDQASGELLTVVRDRRDVGSNMWRRSSTVTASADVRRLFNSWSNLLLGRISGN
jgi:Protein of unknown function (DUF3313)